MQCKDIPDEPILRFLATGKDKYDWFNWYFVDADGKPCNKNVRAAMPDWVPPKLALAKMRMLIRRDLVDGCPCGCRGDFVLTDRGRAVLANRNGGAA